MGQSVAGHKGFTISVRASVPLLNTLFIGRVLGLDGDWANTGREAVGILLENADSGEMVTLLHQGRGPFFNSTATMSAGYIMDVISGRFIAAAAGGYIVGRSLGAYTGGASPGPNTNVASGQLGEALVDFSAAPFLPLSGANYLGELA